MNKVYKLFFLLMLLSFAFGCKSKKEEVKILEPVRDTITDRQSKKTPDPSIAVKDDYTMLTKEDEEREDKTHMDMSYFPSNYALDKAQQKPVQLIIRAIYSRPHKRDRPLIFGDSLAPVPYNKIWRLGANESTEIEFLKQVVISGKKINPGRYTVYAIPNKDNWVIILNSNIFTWGDFNYNPEKDVLRASVPVNKARFPLETFLLYFQKTAEGCNMIMTWDNISVALPIIIP